MTTRNNDWKLTNIPSNADLVTTLPPVVATLLAQRGITDPAEIAGFLDPDQYTPAPASDLPDMTAAVETLATGIAREDRILIWGDFDVDGQTATALLLEGLGALGANTAFYIPDRLTESHGVHIPSLASLIATHNPAILLTCDTGITAYEALDYANAQGLLVIVTDHHDLSADGQLPPATANINPKRLPASHPLRTLPGVGVAYKLMEALHAHVQHDPAALPALLDLVALGIVADVAEQRNDTRYLLQKGLHQLRNTLRPGLHALYQIARIQPEHLNSESIGFQLAPRLNAAGRLDDAAQAVRLLTTQSASEATLIASHLEGLNQKRRLLQRDILVAAETVLERQPELLQFQALVIHQPGWHTGLLGLVAGQLAEKYQLPCVLLTSSQDNAEPLARGSARSAQGLHIGDAIADQADLLTAFGGHAGAAGLSLSVEHIDRFRRGLSAALTRQRTTAQPAALTIDLEVTLKEVTPELVEHLDLLAPYGEGNPPVVLMCRDLRLEQSTNLGRDQRHRRLTVSSAEGEHRQVLWWNGMDHRLPDGVFDLAFTAGWNIYQGRREMALTLVAYRVTEAVTPGVAAPPQQFIDWRDQQALSVVERFHQQEPEGVIWAEGYHCARELLRTSPGLRRTELPRNPALLIYTAPPSRAVLNAVLETTQAQRIYLLGAPPPAQQSLEHFLECLAGLCKFTLNKQPDGQIDLARLAGAIGTTNACVLQGLRYLETHQVIALQEQDEQIRIARPAYPAVLQNADDIRAELTLEMREIESYRRAFRRINPKGLVD